MPVTASKLRENIYRILDQVLETGSLSRLKGMEDPQDRASRNTAEVRDLIDRRDFVRGDPEDIVHLDWSNAWRP